MRLMFDHGNDPFIGSRPIAPIDGLGADVNGAWYFGRLFDTVAGNELRPLLDAPPARARVVIPFQRNSRARGPAADPLRAIPRACPSGRSSRPPSTSFGPYVFPAYASATAGTSTGEHPPRSMAPPKRAMTTAEFVPCDQLPAPRNGRWPGRAPAMARWRRL